MNQLTNKYMKWLNGNIAFMTVIAIIGAILVIVGGFVLVSNHLIDSYFELDPEDRPDIIPDIIPDDLEGAIAGGAVGIGLLLVVVLLWSRRKGGGGD